MDWTIQVLTFIKTHLKVVGLTAGIIVAVFALVYGGIELKEHQGKKAADALYNAQKLPAGSDEQLKALKEVADDYSSTGSGHLAMLIRGETLFTKGEYEEAAGQFGILAKKSKGEPFMHVAALHAMARSLFAAGKIEAAADAYLKAASVPDNLNREDSLYQAARCYEELNNLGEAKKLHQKILDTTTNETAKSKAEERLLWIMARESQVN